MRNLAIGLIVAGALLGIVGAYQLNGYFNAKNIINGATQNMAALQKDLGPNAANGVDFNQISNMVSGPALDGARNNAILSIVLAAVLLGSGIILLKRAKPQV